ncbi:MAG: putative acyl-CoA transferase/carnitine dehydratase [Dehalococcoidales bacterium]|nr:putative acyl-CoA transferase/carnitine dehydratase [Dehalococcoidales bacterium]
MSQERASKELPLSGIRIIEFGAGALEPTMVGFMADFGAEVIKVESQTKIDFIRAGVDSFIGEPDPVRKVNVQAGRYNQNKYSVLMNLQHPKGVALAKKLVSIGDIVTENFATAVFHKLGLSYEELRKVKPDIIMLSASMGGQTGPYRDFRGHGSHMGVLQGIVSLTGWPDRRPCSPGSAFADHYTPYMYVAVVMAALEYHRRTGKGQFIDGSSFEGCLDILHTAVADYGVNGRVLQRRGNHHPAAAPHGVYRCQGEERWCAIAVSNDEEWQSFCQVIGRPAWTSEARFSTLLGRMDNVEELDKLVEQWSITQKAEDAMLKLQQAGVAASVVENAQDMYENPQFLARGHFWQPEEPGLERYTFEDTPARLSKTPSRYQRHFPLMGEHNDYVLNGLLGLSHEEISHLVEEKVVY